MFLPGQNNRLSFTARLLGFLFLLYLLIYGLLIAGFVFKEPDICFILSTGRWIIEHGHLPISDPFSYTASLNQSPYVLEKWLAEIILYLIWFMSGGLGLLIFDTIILTLAFTVIPLRLAYREGLKGQTAFFIAFMATLVSISHLSIRTEIFSFLLLSIWLYLLTGTSKVRSEKYFVDWGIVGITGATMAFWVNSHTLFCIAPLLLAIFLFCQLLEQVFPETRISRFNLTGLIGLIVCFLASLINPYGIELWGYLPTIFGPHNDTNNEMRSLCISSFSNPAYYPFLLYSLIALYLLKPLFFRKPKSPGELFARLLIPIGIAAGVKAFRSLPIAGLFISAGIASMGLKRTEGENTFASKLTNEIERIWMPNSHLWPIKYLLLAIGGSLICARAVPPEIPQASKAFTPPLGSIKYIEQYHPQGNLLNDPHFGDVLCWQLPDAPKVFIDSRYNIFGINLLQDYWNIVLCKNDWSKLLDKYQIAWVFLPPDLELSKKLAKDNRWCLLYADPHSIIFQRRH